MSGLMQKLFPKAAAAGKTLVLPEGHDPRVMQAAKIIADKKMLSVGGAEGRVGQRRGNAGELHSHCLEQLVLQTRANAHWGHEDF